MISSKKSGVISGWQLEPNGDILYSETLPSDTIISESVTHVHVYTHACTCTCSIYAYTCTCKYTCTCMCMCFARGYTHVL